MSRLTDCKRKYDGFDDLVATTGQVFLGLTVNCARCHDHKIDPISQKDYYGLLAFFHNITPYQTAGPNIEVPLLDDDREREQFRASTREFNEKRKKDQAEYSALNRELRARFPAKNGSQRELAEWIKQNGSTVLGEERFQRYRALQASLRRMKQQPMPADYALCVTELGLKAPDTFVLRRGNPHVLGEKVEPTFPRILDPQPPRLLPPQAKTHSTGRRLTLANWIASADNPATARVMVNRIWQHHFGRGIVRSPNNFGYLGDRPTHPKLLDWLAAEFVKNGWRLKPLHRLILTSSAYRHVPSQANPAALARDPANDLFWALRHAAAFRRRGDSRFDPIARQRSPQFQNVWAEHFSRHLGRGLGGTIGSRRRMGEIFSAGTGPKKHLRPRQAVAHDADPR